LPIDAEISEIWGAMAARAQLRGITLVIIDGLLAATATRHDLTLVTRNVRDFSAWDIQVHNPWETA
jgi:predicted nucleic acid-binding protein